jgi:hypothetical protein
VALWQISYVKQVFSGLGAYKALGIRRAIEKEKGVVLMPAPLVHV